MKYLGLILFSATILGCGSQDLDRTPNKEVSSSGINSTSSQAVAFVDIKPASGLATLKLTKKGKTVEVNGSVIQVSTLGGSESFVEQANNNGYIVGGSAIPTPREEIEGDDVSDLGVHAFVQKDGIIKDLGTLGGNYSSASGVNSSGVVVGGSELADKTSQAFKYENNAMSALANLSGGNHSWAHSINNSGYIVGEAKDSAKAFKAVIWYNGTISDLNSLLPANSGWVLTNAQTIDNAGVVTGVGFFNGQKTYFQLNLNITE